MNQEKKIGFAHAFRIFNHYLDIQQVTGVILLNPGRLSQVLACTFFVTSMFSLGRMQDSSFGTWFA